MREPATNEEFMAGVEVAVGRLHLIRQAPMSSSRRAERTAEIEEARTHLAKIDALRPGLREVHASLTAAEPGRDGDFLSPAFHVVLALETVDAYLCIVRKSRAQKLEQLIVGEK